MLNTTQLRRIQTFTDAARQLHQHGVFNGVQYDELTGFGLLPGANKEQLLGVPFLIVQFEFKTGIHDSSYVDCHIITTNDERYILRDSSRGIHSQLRSLVRERVLSDHPHPFMGVYARKGLSYKVNAYELPDGSKGTSKTYYLT